MITPPTKEQAFETAIVDGINLFVREVLKAKGFLIPETLDHHTGLPEILKLKYQIARDLAGKWAKMPLTEEPPVPEHPG